MFDSDDKGGRLMGLGKEREVGRLCSGYSSSGGGGCCGDGGGDVGSVGRRKGNVRVTVVKLF